MSPHDPPRRKMVQPIIALSLVMLFLSSLFFSATAQDEGDWQSFKFDTSTDSYKKAGQRAFDLRSGRYAATEYTRTHSGDFIVMTGFNPKWVTFRTMDWIKILCSTATENDPEVDKKAEIASDCVPVHFGDSYVASFDGRTYTIKLGERYFKFGASYAEFTYIPGGTPGPEHEPRKRSARTRQVSPQVESSSSGELEIDPSKGNFRMSVEESDTIDFFGTGKPSSPGSIPDSGEDDRIDEVTVTVKTPPAAGGSPKRYDLTLTLAAQFGDSYVTKNRDSMSVLEGSKKTYTFKNVRPGLYKARVSYHNKVHTETVDINESNTDIELGFSGAGGSKTGQSQHGRSDTSGRPRPVDKRGPSERVEGWVRVVKVTVTTPPAEDEYVERADMTVELRGPKHFRTTHRKIGPGALTVATLRTFPVGAYELIVKWGDRTITKTVELIDDPTEIDLAFE